MTEKSENGARKTARCKKDGAVFACDYVICQEYPDDDAIAGCKALGAALA